MSLGFSRSRAWIVLFCLVANGLVAGRAYAQGTHQPRRLIELSETNNAEILTNLNQLTVKKEGIRQLEDQLRELKGLTGPKSMERRFNAPFASPTTSAAANKTIKELLERQKNWGLTPEQMSLSSGSTGTDSDDDFLSAIAENKLDPKKSSLQQFYDALNRPGGGRQNADRFFDNSQQNKRQDSPEEDFSSSTDDSKLPEGIRQKAQRLKETVAQDSTGIFNPLKERSSFKNFFGLHENESARNASSGVKTSMESFIDQFKKELDSSMPGARIDPTLQSLLPNASPRKTDSLPTIAAVPEPTHHDAPLNTFGSVSSISDQATALPDVNATVLHSWNPLYTPPKLELPKYTPPSPPNLDFPRRRF